MTSPGQLIGNLSRNRDPIGNRDPTGRLACGRRCEGEARAKTVLYPPLRLVLPPPAAFNIYIYCNRRLFMSES